MSRRGKKRVTCSGILLSSEAIHDESARISSSPSFSPGTISVVSSTCAAPAAAAMNRFTVSRSPPSFLYHSTVKPLRSILYASMTGSSSRLISGSAVPFVTRTFFMPRARISMAQSRTNSQPTSGSL